MSLTQSQKDLPHTALQRPQRLFRLPSWRHTWEMYPLLLLTCLLCFYRLNTTEFNTDQASIFSMARYALHYGLLPITSNAASVGITNPPAVVYILLLPALFSPDPLWAAVQQGLFTLSAVILTYVFTRRYFGRLAAIIAAFLYATAPATIHYARFIWQQNMMSPFIVLFIFALFWGAVEQRKAWLAPAVFLLGLLVQLHESSILLVVPLLIAVLLAFRTLRWRDLALALVALFILFFPYLIWEIEAKFIDFQLFYTLAKQHALINLQDIEFYRLFLSPYGQQPTIASSLVLTIIPWTSWLRDVMPLLVACSCAVAVLKIFSWQASTEPKASQGGRLRSWWQNFRATPINAGLLLLLLWQIVPLIALMRHAIELQPHYLLFLMPGPDILIGFFITTIITWTKAKQPSGDIVRFSAYFIIGLVILGQLLGSVAAVIDITSGNFDDRAFYAHYRNDLASLQHALGEADRLAQQRHFNHVYITTDASTEGALHYLSGQMQTPTTLFDATRCLVLPAPTAGPAVLLVNPYNALPNALLSQFASATLVDQPQRPGGAPFRLYIVTQPVVSPIPAPLGTFGHDLQLLSVQNRILNTDNIPWTVTRWSFLRTQPSQLRTTYHYVVTASSGSNNTSQSSWCNLSSLQPGDQALFAFHLSPTTSLTLGVQSFTTVPFNPRAGPLHFETYIDTNTPASTLRTIEGATSLTVSSE